MKAFKDLEGKIPAKEGDRVALIRQTYDQNLDLIQVKRNRRPIMRGENVEMDLWKAVESWYEPGVYVPLPLWLVIVLVAFVLALLLL